MEVKKEDTTDISSEVPYASSALPEASLPATAAGTIDPAAVASLQKELEETRQELENAKSLYLEPLSKARLRELISKNPTLQELLKYAVEKYLDSRVDEEVRKLAENLKDQERDQIDKAEAATKKVEKELLDIRVELMDTRQRLKMSQEANKARLINLSKDQVQFLMDNNPPLKAMIKADVESQVETSFAGFKKWFDEKNQAFKIQRRSEKAAEETTTKALNAKIRETSLQLRLVEGRMGDMSEQLQKIEEYAKTTPDLSVGFAWYKSKTKTPLTPKPRHNSTAPTSAFGLVSSISPTSAPITPSPIPTAFMRHNISGSPGGESPLASLKSQASASSMRFQSGMKRGVDECDSAKQERLKRPKAEEYM